MKRKYPDLPSYVLPDSPEEIRRVNRLFDIIYGPVKRKRKKKAAQSTLSHASQDELGKKRSRK